MMATAVASDEELLRKGISHAISSSSSFLFLFLFLLLILLLIFVIIIFIRPMIETLIQNLFQKCHSLWMVTTELQKTKFFLIITKVNRPRFHWLQASEIYVLSLHRFILLPSNLQLKTSKIQLFSNPSNAHELLFRLFL